MYNGNLFHHFCDSSAGRRPDQYFHRASAVLGCLVLDYPMMVIGQKMVTGIDSYLLIAIPLFILAAT